MRGLRAPWRAGTLLRATLLALALGLAGPGGARAQEAESRAMTVRFVDGVPRVTVRLRDLADRSLAAAGGAVTTLRARLESGMPQRLVTRVTARVGDTVVAGGARMCRITRDAWDLTYRVELQTPEVDRTETVGTLAEVLDVCLDLDALPVGAAGDWEGVRGAARFEVVIELNPLSPERVEQLRRWLVRSPGAFFGSFVQLFVNRQIGEAEQTLRVRSAEEASVP